MSNKYTRDDLNEKQAKWFDAFIELGGSRLAATNAVKIAYGYEGAAASTQAWRMLRNEKIQYLLINECVASFAAGAVMATAQLVNIIDTGMWHGQIVKPSDGLRAIGSLIDRGIGPIAQIHDHRHNHKLADLSGKELQAQVIAELRKLPDKDRSVMLQQLGGDIDIIDVEAVAVDPDAPWGRRTDGAPKSKPGVKVHEKRYLPGPDAYRPEVKTDLQTRISRIKARKIAERRAKTKEASDER